MKSILILTQYYPPEIGAPQNRLHELAVRIQAKGHKVNVLTAMPNYPKMEIHAAYKSGKIKEEIIDGIHVFRSRIYVTKSKSIVPRLLNYFSFVITSYFRGRKLLNYDYLMVESPPLFLGYSAMRLSRKLKAKLIFNVSDLWPESAEKLGIVTNKTMLNFAYSLEKKCYQRAHIITGQTQGIVDNIKKRFPECKTYWLPNGVDLEYYSPKRITTDDFRSKHGFKVEDILFFYGGILGHAQGLEIILNGAELLKHRSNLHFILQGNGPLKEELLQLKNKLQLQNVHFFDPVPKSEMPFVLKAMNVALVPLKKLDIFQGAIPSKIFEALAMELPLLLGVDGEAKKHFIDTANAGLYFEPENTTDLVKQVNKILEVESRILEMGKRGRAYVETNFNRNKIADDFLAYLSANG